MYQRISKGQRGSVTLEYSLIWPFILGMLLFIFVVAWNFYVAMIFPYYVTETARMTANEIRNPNSPYHLQDPSSLFKDKLSYVVSQDVLISVYSSLSKAQTTGTNSILTDVTFYEDIDDLVNNFAAPIYTPETKIVLYSATITAPYQFLYSMTGAMYSNDVTVAYSYPIYR